MESVNGSEIKTRPVEKVATLRQLLTHTGGHTYAFFNHDTKKYFDAAGLEPFNCNKASISAPLARAPGEQFEYGTNLDWAGQVVERISGMTLDEYFQKNILKPIGVKHISMLPESAGLLPKLASLHQMDKEGNVKLRTGHVPTGKGHIMPLEDGASRCLPYRI
jgi:CubicO group peptidase (beta-lactamase class C family)